jgi:hypothetical protein
VNPRRLRRQGWQPRRPLPIIAWADPADSVVVDISAHIGSFCQGVLSRGAGRVYGFEAGPESFACAERNLATRAQRLVLKPPGTGTATGRQEERVHLLAKAGRV